MKYTLNLKLILSICLCAFLAASCVKEGPMGPPGEDGVDGTDGRDGQDGHITCLSCHSGNSMDEIQSQFTLSAHSAGAIAVDYAGGRSYCAPCHSHEQFVQTMELGGIKGTITNPTAWKCNTCHGLHEEFDGSDYALRSTDPVQANFNSEVTMDLIGNSNLCAICHQSRTAEPNLASPGETFEITSSHYGPHYGTQANIVLGVGLAEIEGPVDYPDAGSSYHYGEDASCVGCHMGEYGAGGGHSFKPNLDACVDCHGTNMDDFNYGGTQTTVQTQLDDLKTKLVELGVIVVDEDGYHPVQAEFPMVHVQAYFNWKGIKDDRSLGAHNPKYVNALLVNTLAALNAE